MLSEERQITDCETCQNSDASDILTKRFHVDLSSVVCQSDDPWKESSKYVINMLLIPLYNI